MTVDEYMDPQRFPLTTQKGLSPEQQMMIDAFNLDSMREGLELGEVYEGEALARSGELEEKAAHRPRLYQELRARRTAGPAPPPADG